MRESIPHLIAPPIVHHRKADPSVLSLSMQGRRATTTRLRVHSSNQSRRRASPSRLRRAPSAASPQHDHRHRHRRQIHHSIHHPIHHSSRHSSHHPNHHPNRASRLWPRPPLLPQASQRILLLEFRRRSDLAVVRVRRLQHARPCGIARSWSPGARSYSFRPHLHFHQAKSAHYSQSRVEAALRVSPEKVQRQTLSTPSQSVRTARAYPEEPRPSALRSARSRLPRVCPQVPQ